MLCDARNVEQLQPLQPLQPLQQLQQLQQLQPAATCELFIVQSGQAVPGPLQRPWRCAVGWAQDGRVGDERRIRSDEMHTTRQTMMRVVDERQVVTRPTRSVRAGDACGPVT